MTFAWRFEGRWVRLPGWQERFGVLAAVSARAMGDMKRPPLFSRFLRSQGVSTDHWAGGQQVHGDRVVTVSRPTAVEEPATDGMVTRALGLPLRVFTADCVPVFLVDPRTRAVALVHAGWRGVHRDIVPRALRTMARRFGSRAQELAMALGPHIRACCYEVGPDVARHFEPVPGALVKRRGRDPGWVNLNLAQVLRQQACRQGVCARAISVAPWCTHCDPRFFSFRRNRTARRQVALLCLSGERRLKRWSV